MSGIAGIIRFDGGPVDPGLIARMTSTMAHRGPDGIRHWVKGSVGLGHCMLHTTPESLEETQPLVNDDESLILVMDGWLENWVELRQELLAKGARLHTRADAELVLRAYETWGEDCLAHIDGDFAFVIWDGRRRLAFAARDHFGMKPLNYMWDGTTFAFASEPRPVIERPGVERLLNEGMVAEFIANDWFTRDETFWVGLNRLVPAHRLTVSQRGAETARYWWPNLSQRLTYKRDEDYFAHYRDVFADCQRRASRSHARVAYEVSGGHDSTANFCMAAQLHREGRLLAPGLDGYHLAYRGDPRADETAFAQDTAVKSGLPIQEVAPFVPARGWFRERVNQSWDFPGYPNGTSGVSLLELLHARATRVVINGEGGDECLAGTRTYYAEAIRARDVRAFAGSFAADRRDYGAARAAWWTVRHGLFRALPESSQDSLRKLVPTRFANPLANPSWMSDRLKRLLEERRSRQAPIESCAAWPGQKVLLVGLQNAFSDHMMEDTDRLSALYGVEARSPMLSQRFLEFSFTLPERLRLRGHTDKYIHVTALSQLLPESVAQRRTKGEFSTSFSLQLTEEEGFFLDAHASMTPPWISPDIVSRMYLNALDNRLHGWSNWVLWSVYCASLLAACCTDY